MRAAGGLGNEINPLSRQHDLAQAKYVTGEKESKKAQAEPPLLIRSTDDILGAPQHFSQTQSPEQTGIFVGLQSNPQSGAFTMQPKIGQNYMLRRGIQPLPPCNQAAALAPTSDLTVPPCVTIQAAQVTELPLVPCVTPIPPCASTVPPCTTAPSILPTTGLPSVSPTNTAIPTGYPTLDPTGVSSTNPSPVPTGAPSKDPTPFPSLEPTTVSPTTHSPTTSPTKSVIQLTQAQTLEWQNEKAHKLRLADPACKKSVKRAKILPVDLNFGQEETYMAEARSY